MAEDGSPAAIFDTAKLKSLGEAVRGDFDSELMLQLRAGVREAGDLLLARNCQRVARFITRVVRDREAIEDLTQDVFVRVVKGARRYEPTARFSTWLFRIATGVAINYLHKTTRRKSDGRSADLSAVPAPQLSSAPERELGVEELRARVRTALGRLPHNQRIAVTLFNFDGFSYEQISTIMSVTEQSVRGLLKRARSTLKAELRDLIPQ